MSSHPDDNQGSPPLAAVPDVPDSAIADPPPPYPDPLRRHHNRTLRSHRSGGASAIHGHGRVHSHSPETHLDRDTLLSPYLEEDDDDDTTESTPFLLANRGHSTRHSRRRSFSHSSTASGATSLTQTVFSLLQGDDDDDDADIHCGGDCADCYRHQHRDGSVVVDDTVSTISSARSANLFKCAGWDKYFAPLTKKVYYRALFHLLVLNFPYALVAWIYLFVLTVVCQFMPSRFSINSWYVTDWDNHPRCPSSGRDTLFPQPPRRTRLLPRRALPPNALSSGVPPIVPTPPSL
jgi:hypothetical protein